jgi:hypothetical protein
MILWAALTTLAAALASLLTLGPVPIFGAHGIVELVAAIALFTAICATEARS